MSASARRQGRAFGARKLAAWTAVRRRNLSSKPTEHHSRQRHRGEAEARDTSGNSAFSRIRETTCKACCPSGLQRTEIIAEHFNREVGLYAGNALVDLHCHRLRKAVSNAGI